MKKILENFDYKNFLIKEYKHWILLLRNEQVTLGSMVLIEKDFKKEYGNISTNSHLEFGSIIKNLEVTLKKLFSYKKINYLMLMMVDPEVHYHVIPRYSKSLLFNKKSFLDTGWPKLPELNYTNNIDINTRNKLINTIRLKINTIDEQSHKKNFNVH